MEILAKQFCTFVAQKYTFLKTTAHQIPLPSLQSVNNTNTPTN